MAKAIITIGRQYGSGGREIGQRLAEKLGFKCYDSELLDRAAKDSGMCQEIFENHDERPTNSFLYSLVMDTYSMGYSSSAFAEMPINHKVFLAQFNAIKEIAKEGPCVGWPLCRLRAGRQSESGICFRSCASGKSYPSYCNKI